MRCDSVTPAVVAANSERRAEREGVFKDIPMAHARHQKSATAERSGEASGEAGRDPGSDEASTPRHETGSTGSALLSAALTRENLLQAFKRGRGNKGAAGGDGVDIGQTARQP